MSISKKNSRDYEHEQEYDHRLVLTHLDPEVFLPDQCDVFLPELLIATLLKREVGLLTVDLVTNRLLAEHFCKDQQAWSVFEDLILNSNAIRLLRHNDSAYFADPHLELSPHENPVEAWASVLQRRGLLGSVPFSPNGYQRSFYKKIDDAFRKADSVTEMPWSPSGSPFAAYLGTLLGSKEIWSITEFSILNPELNAGNRHVTESYKEFAADNDSWARALKAKGLFPSQLDGAKFARNAAYSCLGLFDIGDVQKAAWKSLFQSAYYSNLCSRMKVEGRFGGRLFDLPLEFDLDIAAARTAGEVIQFGIEAAPTALRVAPGIGTAIRRTREVLRVDRKDILAGIWSLDDPSRAFADLWQTITSTVAASIGRGVDSAMLLKLGFVLLAAATVPRQGAVLFTIETLAVSSWAMLPPLWRRFGLEKSIAGQLGGLASARAVGLPLSQPPHVPDD